MNIFSMTVSKTGCCGDVDVLYFVCELQYSTCKLFLSFESLTRFTIVFQIPMEGGNHEDISTTYVKSNNSFGWSLARSRNYEDSNEILNLESQQLLEEAHHYVFCNINNTIEAHHYCLLQLEKINLYNSLIVEKSRILRELSDIEDSIKRIFPSPSDTAVSFESLPISLDEYETGALDLKEVFEYHLEN